MAKIHQFPTQKIQDYGDLFHAVLDICISVEFNGKDHVDATYEICNTIESYIEYCIEIGCKHMTDEYDKLASVLVANNLKIPE